MSTDTIQIVDDENDVRINGGEPTIRSQRIRDILEAINKAVEYNENNKDKKPGIKVLPIDDEKNQHTFRYRLNTAIKRSGIQAKASVDPQNGEGYIRFL